MQKPGGDAGLFFCSFADMARRVSSPHGEQQAHHEGYWNAVSGLAPSGRYPSVGPTVTLWLLSSFGRSTGICSPVTM